MCMLPVERVSWKVDGESETENEENQKETNNHSEDITDDWEELSHIPATMI